MTRRASLWVSAALVVAALVLLAACGTDEVPGGGDVGQDGASPLAGSLPAGWSGVALPAGDITGISFVDDQNGWVCSDDVTAQSGVWRTGDGGARWRFISDAKLRDVCFVDDATGWAVGRGPHADDALYRTTDGGVTWKRVPVADAPHNMYQVRFVDELRGHVVGGQYGADHGGWLLSTTDGGASWKVDKVTDTPVTAMWFQEGGEGWLAGDQDVLHTVDGGRRWTIQLHRENGALAARDMWFVDQIHGWLASDLDGSIWATDDGGRSWRESWRDTTTGVYALVFDDALHGWAVGIRYPEEDALDEGEDPADAVGMILRTADGGVTWTEERVPQVEGLFALTMVGGDRLVAVGRGAVLRGALQP